MSKFKVFFFYTTTEELNGTNKSALGTENEETPLRYLLLPRPVN